MVPISWAFIQAEEKRISASLTFQERFVSALSVSHCLLHPVQGGPINSANFHHAFVWAGAHKLLGYVQMHKWALLRHAYGTVTLYTSCSLLSHMKQK